MSNYSDLHRNCVETRIFTFGVLQGEGEPEQTPAHILILQ